MIGDHLAWWNMVVGHAVISQKISTCAEAFKNLKEALASYAEAQKAFDTYNAKPKTEKPISAEKRILDILGVAGTTQALNTIQDFAAKDAEFKRVESAHTKAKERLEECQRLAGEKYNLVVDQIISDSL
jgi:hypothetical protein